MRLPDGHSAPDFIIAGAPRSATTWLHRLAESHPDVAMARPARPEPKYFLIDELYERGLAYYCETWFDPLPPGRVLGEKSTNYLENPLIASRIHGSLPDVKLVFILRNPVDRAYSNYLWSRENGLETLDFATALDIEARRETPEDLRYARPFAYYSRGLYADLLRPYLALFPRNQVLILRTEDVSISPAGVADDLFTFLGVARNRAAAAAIGTVNATADESSVEPKLRAQLQGRYRTANEELRVLLQRPASLWPEDDA